VAAEYYRSYLRLDDRSPRVLYKLAYARYRDTRPADAADALRRALAIRPRFAEADYLLALCLRDIQQPGQARAALLDAISQQPALVDAREALADLDVALNQPEERLVQLEALSGLDPGADREIALGQGYADAGQHDRAILTLVRAAERYPDEPYAYTALGRAWLEIARTHGDRVALTKATGALQQAIASDQGSEALTLFGRAQLLSGDVVGAERTLEDASRQEPADPLAFYHLAEAAERLGHYAAARDALIDYSALTGDDSDARRRTAREVRLAELSLKMNDPASAAAYFEQAADASPEAAALQARAAAARAKIRRPAGAPDRGARK
jgi:predicted Zn-dependent protease